MEKYDSKAAAQLERAYQTPEIVNQRLRTLAALGLAAGESVLDAGCGTGLLLQQEALAVGRGGRAEGMDYSDDMLALARERLRELPQAGLRQGSIESLPFGDAEFDALSCTQTLLYVERLEQTLDEFFRVLKPGGRLAIVETDWGGAVLNSHDAAMTRRVFDAWDLAQANPNLPRRLRPLLAAAGFVAPRVEAIPILNPGYCENSYSAQMLANFARTARRRKTLTREESEYWLAEVERLIDEDAYFFCVNRFLFSAFKPAAK